VILRSNGSLRRGKPPKALRAKGVEKEEEEDTLCCGGQVCKHPEILHFPIWDLVCPSSF